MSGLQAFQFYIRQRMETALEKETLTTISLPATEVVWYEEGREIMVEGQMFDIKSYTVKDGVFTAMGIFDEEETEVVNLMKGHWSEQDQSQTLFGLLLLSHCIILLALLIYRFGLSPLNKAPYRFFSVWYHPPFLAIQIPPPRQHSILL